MDKSFRKISILLDTNPQIGGAHQYANLMMETLVGDKRISTLALCTNSFWRNWCRKYNIEYVSVDWSSLKNFQSSIAKDFGALSRFVNSRCTFVGKLLIREHVDIFIIASQLVYLPPLKTKVILPIHDLMHIYERSYPEVSVVYEERERILKQQARYADVILTDSELGIRQYKESYRKFINRKQKVYALPFAISGNIMEIEEEYIEVPEKYFFYPAQFWSHKNHLNLIKAVEIVKKDIPDVKLLLPGSKKNCYFEVEKYIISHNLSDQIELLGFISDGQMKYLYSHATAMFMPSIFGPTNIPPIEAMTLGCPVAVSNNYAMPEQVGDAGLLFNPYKPEEMADCMRRFWLDEALRKKLISNGFNVIEKWSSVSFKEKLLDIIFSID